LNEISDWRHGDFPALGQGIAEQREVIVLEEHCEGEDAEKA
jgi:hypothetical protein